MGLGFWPSSGMNVKEVIAGLINYMDSIHLFMCVEVHMYQCRYACEDQRSNMASIPWEVVHLVLWDKSSYLDLRLNGKVRLAGQRALETLLLLSPQCCDYNHAATLRFLCSGWVSKPEVQVLRTCAYRTSTSQTEHLPNPAVHRF